MRAAKRPNTGTDAGQWRDAKKDGGTLLFFKLAQPLDIRLGHRAVLALPNIIRRRRHTMLPTNRLDGLLAAIRLGKHFHNLLFKKSFFQNGPFQADILYIQVETF